MRKSGAVLLGYPDTTQDADLFVEKSELNGARCAAVVRDLRFDISAETEAEIRGGKAFVQLKNGPFDLDLVFALDGIESFEAAWRNLVGFRSFTPMTSSTAKRRPGGPRVSSRFHAFAPSATIGRPGSNDTPEAVSGRMTSPD